MEQIWSKTEEVFQLNLTVKEIIFGVNDFNFSFFMSIVKFYIYKEWLLHKNQNWYHNDILIFVLQELKYRNYYISWLNKLGLNQ